jgi:hypothetical protein
MLGSSERGIGAMRDVELYRAILGLTPLCIVESVELNIGVHQVTGRVDAGPGPLPCPKSTRRMDTGPGRVETVGPPPDLQTTAFPLLYCTYD